MAANPKLPIFVITFQRLSVLKTSLASWRVCLARTPYQLVFCDMNSSYPPLKQFLQEQKRQGAAVYFNKTNDPFRNVHNNIKHYFARRTGANRPKFFVVTDPDVQLDRVPAHCLEVYKHLLNLNPKVECVGPMLRIDDIPAAYPLKAKVMERHGHIWRRPTKQAKYGAHPVAYVQFPIDTTFGMYRAHPRTPPHFRFQNGRRDTKPSLRVKAPYAARHLDWYILGNDKMKEDQKTYMKQASNVAHWGAQWLRKRPALAARPRVRPGRSSVSRAVRPIRPGRLGRLVRPNRRTPGAKVAQTARVARALKRK